MTPPTGLALRDVRVCFAALAAVDGVSFTLPRGEILAVLGPSGCGKSTLLRAIVGLEPLASGTMTWDDGDLSSVPVHRRGFGLVFQEGQLFGHMDVARNIDYGLRVAGMERAARRERVAELLALVGLDGFESREVGTLSGGEQQRVALARALAPRPRLLLLDEPFASLDSHLRTRLAADVREILRAENATAIVVTHDQDEAFAVADRIAIMEAGHLEDIGTPDRLWTWPASKAAARILGCRWFTQGRITMNPTPTLETPWGSVPLPTPPAETVPRLPADGDVAIGLRPGALRVGEEPGEGSSAIVRRRSGEKWRAVDLPDLGPVEVRVGPTLDSDAQPVLDPARIAVIPLA